MSVVIRESGLDFGPFADENVFNVEASNTYSKVRDGVKIVDFMLLRNRVRQNAILFMVEAKSSSPRPQSETFQNYIADLKEKFSNAMSLFMAMRIGRFEELGCELPAALQHATLSSLDVKFVLVVNGHLKKHLPPLKDALERALRATWRTWNMSSPCVLVLNEELAQTRGFVSGTSDAPI